MSVSLAQYFDTHRFDAPVQKEEEYSLTQAHIDALKHEAYQEGYQQGKEEANESLEKQSLMLVNEINQKISNFYHAVILEDETMLGLCGHLTRDILTKIFPILEKTLMNEEVFHALNCMRKNVPPDEPIKLYVAPLLLEKLRGLFSDQKELTILSDPHLDFLDCAIEWEGGRMEKRYQHLQKAALSFLPQLTELLIKTDSPLLTDGDTP
jgi:flagellar biosynthesis/type III secretory pathway protein FliH